MKKIPLFITVTLPGLSKVRNYTPVYQYLVLNFTPPLGIYDWSATGNKLFQSSTWLISSARMDTLNTTQLQPETSAVNESTDSLALMQLHNLPPVGRPECAPSQTLWRSMKSEVLSRIYFHRDTSRRVPTSSHDTNRWDDAVSPPAAWLTVARKKWSLQYVSPPVGKSIARNKNSGPHLYNGGW